MVLQYQRVEDISEYRKQVDNPLREELLPSRAQILLRLVLQK